VCVIDTSMLALAGTIRAISRPYMSAAAASAASYPTAASSGVRRQWVRSRWLVSSEGWVLSDCRQRGHRRLCRRSQLRNG
jgi:hypothetical protein